jgi:hypothetical protein
VISQLAGELGTALMCSWTSPSAPSVGEDAERHPAQAEAGKLRDAHKVQVRRKRALDDLLQRQDAGAVGAAVTAMRLETAAFGGHWRYRFDSWPSGQSWAVVVVRAVETDWPLVLREG